MQSSRLYPVGAHVIIRDTEWRITSVNACDMSDYRLTCVGVSDLVRGKKGIFFASLENDLKLLLPEDTELKQDNSPGFISSKLFIEATVRSIPKTDPQKIYVAATRARDALFISYHGQPSIFLDNIIKEK